MSVKSIKIKICKFLMLTLGKILPNYKEPFGNVGNSLRCLWVKGITGSIGKNCFIMKGSYVDEGLF